MDIFGTAVTAIHEIYAVTMFIKTIVENVRSYDQDKLEIQMRVSHEYLFIKDFKRLFFDTETGRKFYNSRPLPFMNDCNSILAFLQAILGEYKAKAVKYHLIESDDEDGGVQPASDINPKNMVDLKRGRLSRFKERVAANLQELVKTAVHWSIFDKSAILAMLERFSAWTTRLRDTVSWMLGTRDVKDGIGCVLKLDYQILRNLSLQDVFERQESATQTNPPPGFGQLTGYLKMPQENDGCIIIGEPRLAKYSETDGDWDDAFNVIVEMKKYDAPPEGLESLDSQDREDGAGQVESSVRKLAWLLSNKSFSSGTDLDASKGPMLLSFEFRGYKDLADKSGAVFVYDLPSSNMVQSPPTIRTLYGIIQESGQPQDFQAKPSLGNRFFLAHALATTVLNIHASRWVHKSIWSIGVVVTSSPTTRRPRRCDRLVPYLTGWEVARPEGGATNRRANYELLRNIYRHPQRQNQPTQSFKSEHDMYALGVILAEIGLWRTADQILSAEVAHKSVPPGRFLKWWTSEGSARVQSEMGEAYSEVVGKCLEAKKMIIDVGGDRNSGLVTFRAEVVDILALGLEL
jgi:hypothetical protein